MSGEANRGISPALAAIPLAALLALVAFVMGLAIAVGGSGACGGEAEASVGTLKGGVPKRLVPIYQAAAAKYGLGPKGPAMLASVNFNETSFGTNMNNTSGSGAMGWMMFMPETWAAYGVDANRDGKKDPYDPEDAIFAAARYLNASGAPGNWHDAIFAYNHAEWYVQRILEDFRTFQGEGGEAVGSGVLGGGCTSSVGGSAMLHHAERLLEPKRFRALPERLWVGEESPQKVDARIWPDAVWLLETYDLRVTAAREACCHKTHGDGTAMDMVPAAGQDWDHTARRAAQDLGWVEPCGADGVAPSCPLVPAIEFIGYNGFPNHGDPGFAGRNAHLHVSWKSPLFGACPYALCGPAEWVMAFPLR